MAEDNPEAGAPVPEKDTAPQSVIPGDTPAQSGASMGEHCVTDRPTPAGATPTGEVSKIADVDCYVTRPSDYPHSPSKLLLLLSSGTGIQSTNNQLQADAFAQENFVVVMPDMFGGDPAPNSANIQAFEEENPSIIEQVKLRATETVQSFMIDMWLARQTPEKVLPILQKIIAGAKEEFADAVSNGGGVYGVGYCFGGRYILLLGSELPDTVAQGEAPKDEEEGIVKKEPVLKTGACAHGTQVSQQDVEKVKIPLSLVCVENDQLFPDEVRDYAQKHFTDQKIEHEIKTYPGVPHGFAVVGEYEDAKVKEAQTEAFSQITAWLKAH
ncbi:MAG: hypothetical protein MMC23_003376 [Stictis urceolatum]|nr:hypothetical protein [Stictis urceolata]